MIVKNLISTLQRMVNEFPEKGNMTIAVSTDVLRIHSVMNICSATTPAGSVLVLSSLTEGELLEMAAENDIGVTIGGTSSVTLNS